jgi:hypothetical protein
MSIRIRQALLGNATRLWGSTYLLQIVAFTIIYSVFGNHFFHSTAQNELTLKNDIHFLETNLSRILNSHYERLDLPEWSIAASETELHVELDIKDRGSFADIRVFETCFGPTQQCWSLQGTFGRAGTALGNCGEAINDGCMNAIITFCKGSVDDPLECTENDGWLPKWHSIPLHFAPQFWDRYIGVESARDNKPTRPTGQVIRFFYLSVVVTTTLGFGDIVPITDLARLLVALQAILGIVLVGLFLSSLARQSTNGHDDPRKD